MGNELFNKKALTLEQELEKINIGHKGIYIWQKEHTLKMYNFSDFLLQIKITTYNDNQRITEPKLIQCIKNIIPEKDKVDKITQLFRDDVVLKSFSGFAIDDIFNVFFLMTKPTILLNNPQKKIVDKAYYLFNKCKVPNEDTITLQSFAAFILNCLLPLLHSVILCYKKSKGGALESNEDSLMSLQVGLNNHKKEFFTFLLQSGANDTMTFDEINQRFIDDETFLSVDYFIATYFSQALQ